MRAKFLTMAVLHRFTKCLLDQIFISQNHTQIEGQDWYLKEVPMPTNYLAHVASNKPLESSQIRTEQLVF